MRCDGGYFNGLKLVLALAKARPAWLGAPPQRPLVEHLKAYWALDGLKQRLAREETLPLGELKESKRLVKALLFYCAENRGDVGMLFDLLPAFDIRTRLDFNFLRAFFITTVAEAWTPTEQRTVVEHFLALYSASDLRSAGQQHTLQAALEYIVRPMLGVALEQADTAPVVVSADALATVVRLMLDPPDDAAALHSEGLRVELLQARRRV